MECHPSHWRTHIFQDGSNHQPVMFVAVSYSLNSCLISQLRIIWAYCVCVLPSLDPSMPKHEVLRSEHCCLVGFLHMNGLFSNFCPWMDYFPFFSHEWIIVHNIWECHHPKWLIFFRGLGPTQIGLFQDSHVTSSRRLNGWCLGVSVGKFNKGIDTYPLVISYSYWKLP